MPLVIDEFVGSGFLNANVGGTLEVGVAFNPAAAGINNRASASMVIPVDADAFVNLNAYGSGSLSIRPVFNEPIAVAVANAGGSASLSVLFSVVPGKTSVGLFWRPQGQPAPPYNWSKEHG